MSSKQKTNWWIDLVLFAGFITTFFLDTTGVEAHQWIGILFGILAAYHLFLHFGWAQAVTKRLFVNTSGQARKYYFLDALLLLGFALTGVTGLVISTWFNFSLSNFDAWNKFHITISIATLMILLLKLVLHRRWIVSTTRKIWAGPAIAPVKNPVVQPARASSSHAGRREFLQVMGIAGVVSFLALANATKSLYEIGTTSESSDSTESSESQTMSYQSSSSSSTSDCTIRCRRACSYPGHCNRYVDTNNNDRCDFGECI